MDGSTRNTLLTLVGTVLACILTYLASTRATRVQQANTELAQTRQLREDLKAADDEVRKLRREVAVLSRETEQLAAELALLRRTIWRDGMTIARLRQFVGPEPQPTNGNQAP